MAVKKANSSSESSFLNISNSNNVSLKNLIDLSSFTYTAGDYIKIEIIGSILDPTNNNTNWQLYLKCLDSIDLVTINTPDVGKIDLTTEPYNLQGECIFEWNACGVLKRSFLLETE